MKKLLNICFICIFFVILTMPILFFNKEKGKISVAEKRELTQFPKLDNNYITYIDQLENWFKDNIGLREQVISTKSYVDFHLFDKINTANFYIGDNNSLMYADEKIIYDYINKEVLTSKYIKNYVSGYRVLNNYIESQGIQFYYIPCFDKQYIYQNTFMKHINSYNSKSKKELIVEELVKHPEVKTIYFKQKLIDSTKDYLIYGNWSDPTHWTDRGAYIAYLEIMNTIKEHNSFIDIPVLKEEDYNINFVEKGYNLNGLNFYKDNVEEFTLKSINSKIIDNNILKKYKNDKRHVVYKNEYVNNNLNVLVIGDSYFKDYLLDDFVESFYSVSMIWNEFLTLNTLDELIESLKPDIIVLEEAQRLQREDKVLSVAKQILKRN